MAESNLLALLGGPAVRPQGPPDWPLDDPLIADALAQAAGDGSWGKYHAHHTVRFEDALRSYHDVEHVFLCGSGTYAVELGLRALRIGPGDEVLLGSYDYPGNILSVHAVGARPVLVDAAPRSWNVALEALEEAAGSSSRAVIVSHLHGGLVPMRELMAWAHARNLLVLEDAAQVPGAIVQGQRAGTWGDVGTLSFGGSKLLTAGRGGALLTRRADVAQRARTQQRRGNVVCPLSELQAAILLPQLQALDSRNVHRERSVKRLKQILNDLPGVKPFANVDAVGTPAYYKLGFQLDEAAFGLERSTLVTAMRAEGIALDAGFPAAHVGRSPRRFRQAGELTEAQRAHHGTLILHHPVLLGTDEDLEEVACAWRKVHQHASK